MLVRVEKYFRPTEVDILIGDPAWQPTTLFTALVDEMVAADVEAIKSGRDND